MKAKKFVSPFLVPPRANISLNKDCDPTYTDYYVTKKEAARKLRTDVEQLAKYQDMLFAQDSYSRLLNFQAMEVAGKDGTIKHVMSGVNPQECDVSSFKSPSSEELNHDYLWRCMKRLPERGRIGIFNRSYYEEVLVVRVHREIIEAQHLPPALQDKQIWKRRFENINNFEKYISENGIVVLKVFLNDSKEEQKRRFLERIDRPEKNWKFSVGDANERAFWNDYQDAYEDVLNHTSTPSAPWHIIPADHKWYTRLAVADIIVDALKKLKVRYPSVRKSRKNELLEVRHALEIEE